MNIFEAVVAAQIECCGIRRKCWEKKFILKADPEDGYMTMTYEDVTNHWAPWVNDILATDWELPPKGEIVAYWWATRAEKKINDQIDRCMGRLDRTVGQHKKALLELYEHADKACSLRQDMIRRLRDVESWIEWSRNHGNDGWNDAEIMTPGKNRDYWVTVNEDGVRTVKVATYIEGWIVGEAEIVEAWKPIIEEPDPYVRKEEEEWRTAQETSRS